MCRPTSYEIIRHARIIEERLNHQRCDVTRAITWLIKKRLNIFLFFYRRWDVCDRKRAPSSTTYIGFPWTKERVTAHRVVPLFAVVAHDDENEEPFAKGTERKRPEGKRDETRLSETEDMLLNISERSDPSSARCVAQIGRIWALYLYNIHTTRRRNNEKRSKSSFIHVDLHIDFSYDRKFHNVI